MKLIPYTHKVQYYETDQMAIVHHSNYIRWFEEARVDWFDQMGLPFAQVEAMGIQIPVVSCSARYHTSVRYGESVRVLLYRERFNGVRLGIRYEVRTPDGETLYATGTSEHCFTDGRGKILNLRRSHPQICALFETEFEY